MSVHKHIIRTTAPCKKVGVWLPPVLARKWGGGGGAQPPHSRWRLPLQLSDPLGEGINQHLPSFCGDANRKPLQERGQATTSFKGKERSTRHIREWPVQALWLYGLYDLYGVYDMYGSMSVWDVWNARGVWVYGVYELYELYELYEVYGVNVCTRSMGV